MSGACHEPHTVALPRQHLDVLHRVYAYELEKKFLRQYKPVMNKQGA